MVKTVVDSATLRAEFKTGINDNGDLVTVTKNFGEIEPEVSPESIMTACKAFESLLEFPLVRGQKTVVSNIYEIED